MRRTFVLAVGVGLGLTIGASADQPAPTAPAQPAPAPAPAQPQIQWANKFFLPDIATNREQPAPVEIKHNFGEVPHGTLCVHKFTITNIYNVPMQITEVRKSCGCLDYIPMNKTLQPNETADFTIMMNSGKFVGLNTQTFSVTFGPNYVSTATIKVSATSRADVSINPGNVSFGAVPQGTKVNQTLSIKYSGRNRDWKLTEVVPVQGPFEIKLTELNRGGLIRGGAEYQVDVSIKPTAGPGPLSEQVSIKTNDTTHPIVQLMVTGTITAPLEVAPNKVRLDPVAVGQTTGQRVSIRAAKPFKILGVDNAGDGITVELPMLGVNGAPVPNVQVITVKFEPSAAGVVSRVLRIRTDLEGGVAVLPVEAEGLKP
jgi:hypothetical protein